MNNDTYVAFLWIFMALSGIVLYKTVLVSYGFYKFVQRRKLFPRLLKVRGTDSVHGAHTWSRIKLSVDPLPSDMYLVCSECGMVSGTKFKLNKPGLEVMHNNLRLKQEDEQLWQETFKVRQRFRQEVMNKMIKSHVEKFDGNLHKNIELLKDYSSKYSLELDSLDATLSRDSNKKNG